jgi:chromosome segregation ATPase
MANQFENQVMEMLKQMNERMEQGFSKVNEKLDGIDGRLNQVELRLGEIDEKLDGIGGQFEETTKQLIASDDTGKSEMKFLTHKVIQLEKEVFIIGNKQ